MALPYTKTAWVDGDGVFYLKDSSNHYWAVSVSTSGVISTTDTGTTVPSGTSIIATTLNNIETGVFDAHTKVTANTQTGTTYTFVIADAGNVVEMNNASSNTVTVPPNSSVAFPIGTIIEVAQVGAGVTSVAQGAGVTLRPSSPQALAGQYKSLRLRKRATDEWWAE